MNLRLRTTYRLTLAALAAALVAACASHPPPPPAPVPPPPPSSDEGGPPQGYDTPPTQSGQMGPIPGTVQDFVVNVGELVYFDFNASEIRPDAMPVLAGQAQWLRRYSQVRVRIEGNCDERGTREYNFALGARRADSVRSFLIAHGVDAARITTISYGKERPIDPGHDDQAWARNRNAHTAITEGAR